MSHIDNHQKKIISSDLRKQHSALHLFWGQIKQERYAKLHSVKLQLAVTLGLLGNSFTCTVGQ